MRIRLAIVIGLLVACAGAASACGGRSCDADAFADDYPPMRAPVYDNRLQPIWTSNGWIHPSPQGYAQPSPYEPYAERGPRRAMEWPPGSDRPISLK